MEDRKNNIIDALRQIKEVMITHGHLIDKLDEAAKQEVVNNPTMEELKCIFEASRGMNVSMRGLLEEIGHALAREYQEIEKREESK